MSTQNKYDTASIDEQYRQAMAFLSKGQLDAAAAISQDLRHVDDKRVSYLQALIASSSGDVLSAKSHFIRALEGDQDNPLVSADAALFFIRNHELNEAEACLDAAMRRWPDHFGVLYGCGVLCFERNQVEESIFFLEKAVHADPNLEQAWLSLGQSWHACGQYGQAKLAFAEALRLAPRNGFIHYSAAEMLLDAGDFEMARIHADYACKALPGFAHAWKAHARALLGMKDVPAALANAEKAVQLDSTSGECLKVRGHCLQAMGDLNAAAADFKASAGMLFLPRPGAPPRLREHRWTTRAKLNHDIEQYEYLHGKYGGDEFLELSQKHRLATGVLPEDLPDDAIVSIRALAGDGLDGIYNRFHHVKETPALPEGALNSSLDCEAIQQDYRRRAPGITWIDNMLNAEALAALQSYCLESTLWSDFHHPNGYLGASMQNGFVAPLLLQIADELRSRMPDIFKDHLLTHLWAFKYGAHTQGIKLHADLAAVNLNFWITPDDANMDPEGGGLVVWDRKAPMDWGFDDYNASTDQGQAKIRKFLDDSGAQSLSVPYRMNRAVLFDSDLFHATDTINFRPGYENRRINITMLFGLREDRHR